MFHFIILSLNVFIDTFMINNKGSYHIGMKELKSTYQYAFENNNLGYNLNHKSSYKVIIKIKLRLKDTRN